MDERLSEYFVGGGYFMLWKSSYETGVDEIDRQNFDLLSCVEAMMGPDAASTKLIQLETFETLVTRYFTFEQGIHTKSRYFDADKHEYYHAAYIKSLQGIKRNFEKTGATLENEKIFIREVVEPLQNHIMCHDKLFAFFFHNNIAYA